ncbi:insulin gene enhancer protein ISL-2 isoform X1 [Pan paniscus]|uniref:insulin gene enhancer protein ISL-2 isoform X1 n=1 Tax=Pan paniscus TaxID=9597 RepID=UPI00300719D3
MVDIIFHYPFLGAMGDHSKKKPGTAMCVGCGSQIHDQFILRVSPDLEWHAACLKCAECSQYLDETCTCFVRDGKTYCKRDYVRLFGIKCAKCQVGFSSSDLVMRARDSVYHIECFRCSVCSRQLLPGDEFSLREHELLCRADHGLLLERAAAGSPRSPGPLPGARGLHLPDAGSGRQPALRPHVHKQTEKTTRVRTVLNEKQLHTLRTCYAANPRPDALMKEQLVEMTGLSPRVIRVWFQNKRCKDKKKSILMKQLQQQQHSDKTSLQGLTGTPLVAGSPIRHENAVQGSAVEVQTYQPPWKALSEFALQSDLDQPAFQQLGLLSAGGRSPRDTFRLGARGPGAPARVPLHLPLPGVSAAPGLLLRVRLPRQLLRQRRDLPVLAAPGHPQQYGAESRGDVRGTPPRQPADLACSLHETHPCSGHSSSESSLAFVIILLLFMREDRETWSGQPKAPGCNLLSPDCRPLLRGLLVFQNQNLGLTRVSSALSSPLCVAAALSLHAPPVSPPRPARSSPTRTPALPPLSAPWRLRPGS